jgi:hypothetical protein
MRNGPAVWSVVVGVLAVAALPAAIWYVDRDITIDLIWASVAIPVAYVLGAIAMILARAGRRRAQMTLLRRSGSGAARLGRLLGLAGILLAGTGTISLAVYGILTWRGRT